MYVFSHLLILGFVQTHKHTRDIKVEAKLWRKKGDTGRGVVLEESKGRE